VIYLDVWPLNNLTLVVLHPDMAPQCLVNPNLPKHIPFLRAFTPLTQNKDVVFSTEEVWKPQRALYNPAFAAKNIFAMTPWFLQEINIFKSRLLSVADTDKTIELWEYTMHLAFDMIIHATL
jgi:cytochrome P450